MAITFRDLKGSALSHQEMDTNLASYYLSSSVSGSTITFFQSGSGGTIISSSHILTDLTGSDTTYTASGSGLELNGTVFTNTLPDQEVILTGEGSTVITGTYPTFIISSSDNDTTYTNLSEFTNDVGYITSSEGTLYTAGQGLTLTGTEFSLTDPHFSGDYNDLTNQPTIPTVPTDVSAFTNDANYMTSASAVAEGFGQGGVTSIIAGSGISINQGTGDVTVTALATSGSIGQSVIAPFAFAYIDSQTSGTGIGVSYGAYQSGPGEIDVTFNTAQANTNYAVVTDNASFDDIYIGISGKSTTGFTLQLYNSNGDPVSPASFPITFLVYGEDPIATVGVAATGSLVSTGSLSSNTLTFTKGDGTTFDIDLSSTQPDTGSFYYSSSAAANILTFHQGDGTTETIDLTTYLDDTNLARVISGVYDTGSQELIFTRDDSTTFSIDASMFFDDTNLVLSVNGNTGAVVLDLFDGNYNNLTNLPTLFSEDYNDLTNKPTLFDGDYNSLTNQPAIPTVPTNVSAFTNDAGYITQDNDTTYTAGTGLTLTGTEFSLTNPHFSGDYNDLTNQPTIPTNNNELINGAGYITGYSETDTLASVTGRGNSTTTTITAANFITTSDRRLKSEIKPIQEGLETIKKFVSYEYIKDGVQDAGFIAQEVQEAIPYSVQEGDSGYLTMNDRPVLAHMHKAILEIEARLSAIEEKLG